MISSKELVLVTSIVNFMFFASGIDKLLHYNKVVIGLQKRLEPSVSLHKYIIQLMIVFAIVIELFAPLIVVWSIFNKQYRYLGEYAMYSLIFFTVFATLIYHFPPLGIKWYPFSSNITTIGALIACVMLLKYA